MLTMQPQCRQTLQERWRGCVLDPRLSLEASNGYSQQIAPSVTPLNNLNSGFRVYEVDSAVSPYCNSYLEGTH